MKPHSASLVLGPLLALGACIAVAQQPSPPVVDWGGGYSKGGDSASVTPATSGGAQRAVPAKPAAKPPKATPPRPPERLTDWGGGYFKGGDSASVTPATAGAGTKREGR